MNQLLKTNPERRTAICRVPVDDILSLRHRLLRAGLPPESAQFKGDDNLSTWHIALFHPTPLEDNTPLVCCASFMFNSYKSEPAWQLRGDVHGTASPGLRLRWLVVEDCRRSTYLRFCNTPVLVQCTHACCPFLRKARMEHRLRGL